jgi:poly(beta-D-mannuronate) lyase
VTEVKIIQVFSLAPKFVMPFALLVCFGAASAPLLAADAPNSSGLHSPWDLAPPSVTNQPFECGPPTPIGPDITVGSLKDNLSDEVKDAAYGESTTGLRDLAKRVTAAADNFLSTGSRSAAECVVNLLNLAASNRAMTGYLANKDFLAYQDMALRAYCLAFLKVRSSGAASSEQTQVITGWMESLVREERSYYEHAHCGQNGCALDSHHGIEAALAAMEVGVAANDAGLVHWAEGRYRSAIKEIDGRGMLHYDLQNEYALKAHIESAQALVRMAQFGEINSIALYSFHTDNLQRLVHTVALGVVDPNLFRRASNHDQKIPSTVQPWEVSWAWDYSNRFPDPVVIGLLHQSGTSIADMWGEVPW